LRAECCPGTIDARVRAVADAALVKHATTTALAAGIDDHRSVRNTRTIDAAISDVSKIADLAADTAPIGGPA